MRKKKIDIPLYFGELTIIQAKDLSLLEKKYDLPSMLGYEACCFRNHLKNGYSRYVLAFENNTNARIVAHEALHLVALIYEDRGILFDIENDEHQCYFIGWIVGECTKFLKTKNKKL